MNPSTLSRSRITAVALGYIVMLAGALSLFTLSFYSTFGLLAIGTAITLLSDRTSIPMTRTSWTLLLAGFVVIFLRVVFIWSGAHSPLDSVSCWIHPSVDGHLPWLSTHPAFVVAAAEKRTGCFG